MNLSVREIQLTDIELVIDYFVNADSEFLKGMGADKSKLPEKVEWIKKLQKEFGKTYKEKKYYYIIWLLDGKPVGHSNINHIEFGKSAKMHLHLWGNAKRQKGFGLEFLENTIPYYFKNFNLEYLICEPYAKNIAPNRTLKKLGFEFIKTYETTPGIINFLQMVNRYELKREEMGKAKWK